MLLKKTSIFCRENLTLLILYLIPILGTGAFVCYFGVNVPQFDQWVLPYWFEKFAGGTLTLKNLFAQHNTHRIFFPKLIFIALSFTSNWNIKWELYFSFFLAILTFLALYRLSEITAKTQTKIGWNLANLSGCVLLFSWVQHENWLWGFQISIFLINLCVILSCLTLTTQSLKPQIKLTVAAILCGIASFTSAQGLLSWLAIIPAVWTVEGSYKLKKKRLFVWLGLFLLFGLIYAIGYRKETDTVPVSIVENKILATVHFFFNVIAAPFLNSPNLNWLIGLILFLGFWGLTLSAFFSEHPPNFNRNNSPWISIGLFSLLCGALIALGRSGLGADYGIFTSRYTTHSLLFPIALIQLCRQILFDYRPNFIRLYRRNKLLIFGCLTGILVGLNVVISANTVNYIQFRVPLVRQGKTCFHLIQYLEPSTFLQTSEQSCIRQIHSAEWSKYIWDAAPILKRLNFRKFAENVTFIDSPQKTSGEINAPQPAEESINISTSETVTIEGWIERSKNPDLVLFSLGDNRSFFASTYAADISSYPFTFNKFSGEPALKWEVKFSADFLPAGTNTVRAWIYDPSENQFVKLDGEATIGVINSVPSEPST